MAADFTFDPGLLVDDATSAVVPNAAGALRTVAGGAAEQVYDLVGTPMPGLSSNSKGVVARFKAGVGVGVMDFGSVPQPVVSIEVLQQGPAAAAAQASAALSATSAASSATSSQASATAATNAAALVGAPADAAIATAVTTPGTATKTALSAAYVGLWRPATAYLAGQIAVTPSGNTVTAISNHTSSAAYATDTALWSVVSGGGGVAPVTVLTGSQTALSITQNTATDALQYALYETDNAANPGTLLKMKHYGTGYGFDIQSFPGADSSLVVHQYSAVSAAFQLDNTQNQPCIIMRNTQNQTTSPGTKGTGVFLDLLTDIGGIGTPNLARFGQLDKDINFVSYTAGKPWTFRSAFGIAVAGLMVSQAEAAAGLTVVKSGADGTSPALWVQQSSPSPGLTIDQSGANSALKINTTAGAAGLWPMTVDGQNYGPRITTATDNGESLTITKNGTGGGRALLITNKGTANSIEVADATSTRFAITPAGLPKWVVAANVQTTVGAAGGASAPPATPTKWLKVVGDNGTTYVVAAYAAV